MLIAIPAKDDLEIEHVDIQRAFLNGVLEEEIFVEHPHVSLMAQSVFGDC